MRFSVLLSTVLLAALLLPVPAPAQLSIGLPDRAEQSPGTPVDLPVLLLNAIDAEDAVRAYELSVAYDPSVLTVTDATSGGTLSEAPAQFDVDLSEPGQVTVSAAFDAALIGGPDELVVLEADLSAEASGSSALVFSEVRFNDGTPPSSPQADESPPAPSPSTARW